METYEVDTDLDDDDDDYTLPPLSFDKKLSAHQSNRLNETFGQINIPFQSNKEIEINNNTLLPIRNKTSHINGKFLLNIQNK
jgi:hypothetical protein